MTRITVPKILNILYSIRCNLRCAHCCVEASPEENDRLDMSLLKEFIEDFSFAGCNTIHILGGEPFLFFEDVCRLVKVIRSLGVTPIITTNGYWGTRLQTVHRSLAILKKNGLKKLIVSHDRFHNIPLSSIRRIVKECNSCGIDVTIKSCISKKEDNKELLVELTELKELGAQILFEGILRFGRARDLDSHLIYFRDINFLASPCGHIFNFSLLPTGDLWACCNSDFRKPNPLFIGNIINGNDIMDRVANSEENKLFKYLAICGPYSLLGACRHFKELEI